MSVIWKDETAVRLLVGDARRRHLWITISRVGEDRRERQLGRLPVADGNDAMRWLESIAGESYPPGSQAELYRIRSWNGRKAVSGVTTAALPVDDGRTEGMPACQRCATLAASNGHLRGRLADLTRERDALQERIETQDVQIETLTAKVQQLKKGW